MKVLVVILSVTLSLCLNTFALAASVTEGAKIVDSLLKNKKATYMISGALTPDPRLDLIFYRKQTWQKLSQDKKESVCLYTKSMIPNVKIAPYTYINISPVAPAYEMLIKNSKNMCLDCWGIVDNDGGSAFVIGDEPWSRRASSSSKNIGFSAFSKGKYKEKMADTRGTEKLTTHDILPKRVDQFNIKMSKEQYYALYYRGVNATEKNLEIQVRGSFAMAHKHVQEEYVKNAFKLWMNIGGMMGVREVPDNYEMRVIDESKRIIATWDSLRGFVVKEN